MIQPRDFFIEGVSQRVPISKIRHAFEQIFEPHLIRDIHCHLHNEGEYVNVMDVSITLSADYIDVPAFYEEIHRKGYVPIKISNTVYKIHVNSYTMFPLIYSRYITPDIYEAMRYPSLYISKVIQTNWHIQQLLCFLFIHPSNVYSMKYIPNEDGTFALFIHPRQDIPSNPKIDKLYKKLRVQTIPFDFESHKTHLPIEEQYKLETGNIIYSYRIMIASKAPREHLEKVKNFRRSKIIKLTL